MTICLILHLDAYPSSVYHCSMAKSFDASLTQQYDKLIKECLTESLSGILTHALHINAQTTVLLDSKLQATEEREADFLVHVNDNAHKFLLHLEFQSTNDPTMAFRMLRYWLFIMQQHSTLSQDIRQYVIYIGKAPLTMQGALVYEHLQYTYTLIDIRSVPATPFLNSENPVEIIFAVLCAYQDKNLLIDKILQRLKDTVVEELRLSKYIRQLTILAQLRNIQDVVHQKINNMDRIFDINKDPIYKQGIEEGERIGERIGEKRGEKRGEVKGARARALAVVRAMKQAGEPLDKIAAYTQLTVKEIESIEA